MNYYAYWECMYIGWIEYALYFSRWLLLIIITRALLSIVNCSCSFHLVAGVMSSSHALYLSHSSNREHQNKNHEINNGLLLTYKHLRSFFKRKQCTQRRNHNIYCVRIWVRVLTRTVGRSVAYSFAQFIHLLDTFFCI